MKKWRIFIIVLGVLFGLAQLIPVEHSNPASSGELLASSEVKNILVKACYDCHSNKTRWPWYSYVAPVSWFVADHVTEGREHLNFSNWQTMDPKDQGEALEETAEVLQKGEMPLPSYLLGHPEAQLTPVEIRTLQNWLGSQGG